MASRSKPVRPRSPYASVKRTVAPTPAAAVQLPAPVVETALLSGEQVDLLETYFGEENYAELQALARQAASRSVRGGPRVLVIPGTMGTKLGIPGGHLFGLDDSLWLDPGEISRGGLLRLSLRGGDARVTALEPLLLFYLKLKLRLRAAGFDADFWGYDWRQDIADTAARLAAHLKKERAGEVAIVAHSMGGLVARAALKLGAPKVSRLVMLGTPNHGSFLASQAIRATLGSVRKLAALDFTSTPEELCEKSFNTFPSTYQLLPDPKKFGKFDLYDAARWPKNGARFDADLLSKASRLQAILAPADERFHLVAGVNQNTATDLDLTEGEFVYTETLAGDGTVPLALAQLQGAATWYVDEEHGSLPNNAQVARGVIEILNTGATSQLAQDWKPARATRLEKKTTEAELRATVPDEKRRGQISAREARYLLEPLLSPVSRDHLASGTTQAATHAPALTPSAAALPRALELHRVVVGRRRQKRLEICVAEGDITEVNARAIVLGLFREVAPGGAALALDERLGGAICDFVARRMFAGNVGEVFILPTGRHPVQADLVLFAGLGAFDTFNLEVLQLVAENVVRTLIRTNVEDLATVLLGSGTGIDPKDALRHILEGFVKAIRETDESCGVRRVTFCVRDPEKCRELGAELFRLAGTDIFKEIEVNFETKVLPATVQRDRGLCAAPLTPEPAYVIVRQEGSAKGSTTYRSALLTAGAKAAVITGERQVSGAALDEKLSVLGTSAFHTGQMEAYGRELAEMVLAPDVLAVLPRMLDRPMVIVHDAMSGRVPWELINIGGKFPVLGAGLNRKYLADNLSVAKWLETRRDQPKLKMLLVVNPNRGEAGHLEGADKEGARILELFAGSPLVEITQRAGAEATRARLLQDFRSGEYDVLHYAGHAFFDPEKPSRSGILCRGGEVLSGADLASLGNLPNLVVFNACESGRVRSAAKPGGKRSAKAEKPEKAFEVRARENTGLAESFLRGGVANYVGTYWPVGDDAAKEFAGAFYTALLRGESVGTALSGARLLVRDKTGQVDWADYIHYGNHHFVLKKTKS
jgi:pimeloyl-ACP methyl ester carboxylesterase/O-acetyl-ADP-ribose deacetylase (regulator of RNase III)